MINDKQKKGVRDEILSHARFFYPTPLLTILPNQKPLRRVEIFEFVGELGNNEQFTVKSSFV